MIKNIDWFKKEVASTFTGYVLNYKFFDKGDFGSLNQVEFNSDTMGGNIDFWELGWLGIFVWDYKKEEELINVLLEPHQEKEKIFEHLLSLLDNNYNSKNSL
jgi:hypothetical protein